MKKRGFTLIELLAVIIILAIIAVIAVPTIINIITKARKSAFKDSAYGIIKAGELYYSEKILNQEPIESDYEFIFPNDLKDLKFKGNKPSNGNMIVSKNGDIAVALSDGKYCVRKGYQDNDVIIEEDINTCETKEQANTILISDIKIEETEVIVSPLETKTLNIKVEPSNATYKELEYTSSDNSIATVNDGIIAGISNGSAVITVKAKDRSEIKRTVDVTVRTLVSDIEVSSDELILSSDDIVTITTKVLPSGASNKNLEWSSSNTDVVTVDNGEIKAINNGQAEIIVRSTDGSHIEKKIKVTVRTLVNGIELNKTSVTLSPLETETIIATVNPGGATNKDLEWTSSDNSVATVNNGIITGISNGNTTITVRTKDGTNISKTINVSVRTLVNNINVSTTNVVLAKGETTTVTALPLPATATNKNLKWISNNPGIVTVNNGLITGVSNGATTVIVKSTDGSNISKTINVAIKAPYKDNILNGADPQLGTNMIPVTISNDGTVKKVSTTENWYNYSNKNWANAVTVNANNRTKYLNAPTGTKIEESDILTYLVWIPRYKYKLWHVEAIDGYTMVDTNKVHSIDIVFENNKTDKSTGNTNGTYLTHPAFTFGEKELNGLWVGKFETTGTVDNITIKPNVPSLMNKNISSMFQASRNMQTTNNKYGFDSNIDTHMMKSLEWGAIVYLSHSKYGVNAEIYMNNIWNKTGCGGLTVSETPSETCTNAYGTVMSYPQSTTGNISGIFDMSGGSYEYVMGYTTGSSILYGSSGFTKETFPESKYIDIYTSTGVTQYSNRKLGDETGEMGPFSSGQSSWYNDTSIFIGSNDPWFKRGGLYDHTSKGGAFYFYNGTGDAYISVSFRIVISSMD